MPKIDIYTKPDCGKCTAAKEKMVKMGFEFDTHDLEYYTTLHDGWRDDGSVEVMAAKIVNDDAVPLIKINRWFYDYPAAMLCLKKIKKEMKK